MRNTVRAKTEYSTAAPFIVPRVLESGAVKFDRTPTVSDVNDYVKCSDEHSALVYVPRDYVELYKTYVSYMRGERHFYDRGLSDKLRNLVSTVKHPFNDPEKEYEAATSYYEQAAEHFSKAVELEKQQKAWAKEIADLEAEIERQDREGYARLFGGDDDE